MKIRTAKRLIRFCGFLVIAAVLVNIFWAQVSFIIAFIFA